MPGFDESIIADLDDNNELGRLDLSKIDDLSEDGRLQQLYMFGSRDFSVYK